MPTRKLAILLITATLLLITSALIPTITGAIN